MTTGWSWYVIFIIALNIVGCVWLLWWTGRRRPGDPAPTDTSHVWDENITEYNKPLPRWWINLFYLTILFSVAYLLWFPGLGSFAGFGKWTSVGKLEKDQAIENEKLAATFAPFKDKPIDQLAQDPRAVALGRSIFSNTCATCHGSAAKGAIGYPNLTDNHWNWGGTPEKILETITDGRQGVMPGWEDTLKGIGGENAVLAVATYVRAFSEPELRGNYFATQGKSLYENICVACHGVEGKGNQELGAPDLTDDDWVYGGSTEEIMASVAKGRSGTMPAHGALLGPDRTRLVAAYVWSLSHPKNATEATTGSK